MNLSDSRKLLARYRLRHTECFSTPELADAIEAVLKALDGRESYSKEEMKEWLKPVVRSVDYHPV
jgi:hypothetical protein